MTAVRRLYLVRHAGTTATARGDFATDEPLTAAGTDAASALAALVPGPSLARCSPTARARQTAAAAGWEAVDDVRLGPLDVGSWRGQRLHEMARTDPADLQLWLSDPVARPHGGETIAELLDRVAALLDGWHEPAGGDLLAVTHAAVIRAAVVASLGAPSEAFWHVDVAPASVTELHTRGTGWVLFRCGQTAR